MTHVLAMALAGPPSNVPKLPDSPYFWLPVSGSKTADISDPLFNYIMWVSVISCLMLMGLMILFVWKYKAKDRHAKPTGGVDHHTGLELLWSIVPVPVLVAMFVWGFQGFVELRTTPKDAYEVRVTAQKWKWLFTYPDGYTDDQLHVPMGQKTRVIISAMDVLHSLYLPAFRQKIDAVPGRYTELWFEPTAPGEYPIFCAEYCGTGHSAMLTKVVVHEAKDFDAWMKKAQEIIDQMPPLELGEKMYNQQGCAGCHTLDGSPKTGPSWKGLFGRTEPMSDGKSIVVDENYIRESILDPQAKLVQGFPPAMPTFKGKLSDKKIDAIVAFIKAQK